MENFKKNADQIYKELKARFIELGFPIYGEEKDDEYPQFSSLIFFKKRESFLRVAILPNDSSTFVGIGIWQREIPQEKFEFVSELMRIINKSLGQNKLGAFQENGTYVIGTGMNITGRAIDKLLFHKTLYQLFLEVDFYGSLIEEQCKSDKTPTVLWNRFLQDHKDRELEKEKGKTPKLVTEYICFVSIGEDCNYF